MAVAGVDCMQRVGCDRAQNVQIEAVPAARPVWPTHTSFSSAPCDALRKTAIDGHEVEDGYRAPPKGGAPWPQRDARAANEQAAMSQVSRTSVHYAECEYNRHVITVADGKRF